MNGPERFRRLDELFRAAIATPPDQRRAMLDAACPDAPTRVEIDALLGHDAADADLVYAVGAAAVGVLTSAGEQTEPFDDDVETPEVEGFRLVRLIGRGGMGDVYEAEQVSPHRRVALKLIRAEATSAAMLRRFELEGEFLARLDHPGVATIFATGSVGEPNRQRPYLAMEMVDGSPITRHAAERGLDLQAKLELFCAVCDAVRHAHERGIIHRDLKPANILVRADGRPKVVDFGVARAVRIDANTLTAQTQTGQIVGTLAYMSPEQLAGDGLKADTRSDVYSLGVVLFELLTGELPCGAPGDSLPQLIRAIAESPARRAAAIDPSLAGDADVILARALAKAPAERYQGVAEFAADLRRHLAHEPVLAREPSSLYTLGKFTARNRGLVGIGAAGLVVMAVALVAVSVALGEARRQRSVAEHKKDVLAGVNAFLTEDVIGATDPFRGGRGSMKMLDAINKASESLEHRFKDAPEVEAAVRGALGNAYLNLNRHKEAETHLSRAVELSSPERDAPEMVSRMLSLTKVWMDMGRVKQARELIERGRRVADEHAPDNARLACDVRVLQAALLFRQGKEDEGEAVLREAAATGRARAPGSHSTENAVGALAMALNRRGKVEEAEPLTREALGSATLRLGAEHPSVLMLRTNLALIWKAQGRGDDAIAALREIVEVCNRSLGDRHGHTWICHRQLGNALAEQTRYDEAEPLLLAALKGLTEVFGPNHPHIGATRRNLASLYEAIGDHDEAAKYLSPEP